MTTEPIPTRDDGAMSAFERAYAADVGEPVEALTARGLFRWHGRCYVNANMQAQYRGWRLSQAAAAAEIARLQDQLAASQAQAVELADALQELIASRSPFPSYTAGREAQTSWAERIAAAEAKATAALSKVGR